MLSLSRRQWNRKKHFSMSCIINRTQNFFRKNTIFKTEIFSEILFIQTYSLRKFFFFFFHKFSQSRFQQSMCSCPVVSCLPLLLLYVDGVLSNLGPSPLCTVFQSSFPIDFLRSCVPSV